VLAVSKVSRSPILILSGSIPDLKFSDVQKHIGPASIVRDEPKAAVSVPHFQFAGGQSISSSPWARLHAPAGLL
jgi:hypothetical protein